MIQLSRIYLNKWAEYVAKIFSITVLFGAIIAYWILMSNFLYNSVNFIYDSIAGMYQQSLSANTSYLSEREGIYSICKVTINVYDLCLIYFISFRFQYCAQRR